jgi:hypothetical protein
MQSTKNFLYAIILIILLILSACLQEQGTLSTSSIYTEKTKHTEDTKYTDTDKVENTELTESTEHTEHTGQIYLYGEIHGVAKILDKEFELWCDYYQNDNMRYLFVERGYFTAEFLNLWMQSDNDAILDELYNDLEGTPSYNNDSKEFYKRIKSSCPETVFHGTDVGHLYYSTGKRYLKYLRKNGMKDSEQYKLAQDAIQQGEFYYENQDDVYRENLHLDKDSFETLLLDTQERTEVRADIIEKDYYVTLMLKELAENQSELHAYFKGGTALYKAL